MKKCITCVTLGNIFKLSEHLSPQLQNENIKTHSEGLFYKSTVTKFVILNCVHCNNQYCLEESFIMIWLMCLRQKMVQLTSVLSLLILSIFLA